MRFLSLAIVLLLSCAILCATISAQSIAQGGPVFTGGEGGGSASAQSTAPLTLAGSPFSLPVYQGGNGHGSSSAQQQTPATLSGQAVAQTLYQGGPSDGYTSATKDTAVTLSGETSNIPIFQGGIADGAAADEARVLTLGGGTLDLTLYKGGAGDGWGRATFTAEKALDGNAYTPTLFFGGVSDGWAMAASKDQTLQGEVLPLSLYQGGQGDGWAIYTSKSQSLDGAQEDLVLFKGGMGDGYHTSVFISQAPATPLPVELAFFSAHRLNNEQVELRWTTASEQDNAGFEVWRSDNTTKAWQQLAFVEGAGNSAVTRRYTFLDNNTHTGTSYYRLRQVDTDGTATFSKTVATRGADFSRRTAAAWPIPADDYLIVQAPDVAQPASLQLYSADARLLLQRQFTNRTELDLRHLPSGLYFLHVFQAGQPPTIIKVMKAP